MNKKFNPDNLIYRYNVFTADVTFDEFDNALNLLDNKNEGKIRIVEARVDQTKFK